MPIGSFQALQHRMADMLIAHRAGALDGAAGRRQAPTRDDAARAAHAPSRPPRRYDRPAGRFVGQQAVQLHGGMGMTDELMVSHYFKRLTLIESTFGDTDHHLERFSRSLLAA